MYRIERPPEAVTLKSFTLWSYGLLVLSAFFMTPILMAIGCLAHDRYRKFVNGPPQATSHA